MSKDNATPPAEPCPHCGKTGELTYNSAANDTYCALCGNWYGEPKTTSTATPFHCDECGADITGRQHVLPDSNNDVLCEECGALLPAHTPAPWKVHVLERTEGDTIYEIEQGSYTEDHIADVFSAHDASLIAAAPELLKACRLALRYGDDDDMEHPSHTLDDACDALEAAIAKAEGK